MGEGDESIRASLITVIRQGQGVVLIPDIAYDPFIISLVKYQPFAPAVSELVIDVVVGARDNLLIVTQYEGVLLFPVDGLHAGLLVARSPKCWLHFNRVVHAQPVTSV